MEQEFAEEEGTDFQHRDKNKEANVMEWVAKVISEPMQAIQQKLTLVILERWIVL